MTELLTTQNLVEAGGVLIALVSIYLNYKLVSNHIEHNTSIMSELKEAISQLTAFLKK